jgi:predicted GNAT superfamily acetyltransferase
VPNLVSLSSIPELVKLIELSDVCIYVISVNEIVGFVVCFRELAEYHSLNYKFFNKQESKFIYVDRVAIKEGHTNKGFGSNLYKNIQVISFKTITNLL